MCSFLLIFRFPPFPLICISRLVLHNEDGTNETREKVRIGAESENEGRDARNVSDVLKKIALTILFYLGMYDLPRVFPLGSLLFSTLPLWFSYEKFDKSVLERSGLYYLYG